VTICAIGKIEKEKGINMSKWIFTEDRDGNRIALNEENITYMRFDADNDVTKVIFIGGPDLILSGDPKEILGKTPFNMQGSIG